MITIKPLTDETHLPAIMAIARTQLGEAYLDENSVKNQSNIALVALVDHEVAGFCISKIIGADSFMKRSSKFSEIEPLQLANTVGLLDSIATKPEFEGNGVEASS